MNIKQSSSVFASLVFVFALFAGTAFVAPAFAADNDNDNGQGWGMHGGGMRARSAAMMGQGIFGTVSSISGNTLTVLGREGAGRMTTDTASTTFTVDASNATVMKDGTTSTLSSIAVGDMVSVRGTMSGASVTATLIHDGLVVGRPGAKGELKKLDRVASSSPIQGTGEPVVAGSVTAVSGSKLTLTNKSNVTYSVDASNAKVVLGRTVGALSDVVVGDNVVVQGAVNGTSVVASSVVDQKKPANTTGNPQSHMGGFFGGIGSFFKHLFGF